MSVCLVSVLVSVLHRWNIVILVNLPLIVILLKLQVNLRILKYCSYEIDIFELEFLIVSLLGLCFRFGEQLGYYCKVWNQGVHGGIAGWC